jgi:hypothetical protein
VWLCATHAASRPRSRLRCAAHPHRRCLGWAGLAADFKVRRTCCHTQLSPAQLVICETPHPCTCTMSPDMESFVELPPDTGFGLANLPWGVFSRTDGPCAGTRTIGVALGNDTVVDMRALEAAGLLTGPVLSQAGGCFRKARSRTHAGHASAMQAPRGHPAPRPPTHTHAHTRTHQGSLNELMSLGRPAWREARATLQRLLSSSEGVLRDDAALRAKVLVPRVCARAAGVCWREGGRSRPSCVRVQCAEAASTHACVHTARRPPSQCTFRPTSATTPTSTRRASTRSTAGHSSGARAQSYSQTGALGFRVLGLRF